MSNRPASANAAAHGWADDVQALGSATLVIALGLSLAVEAMVLYWNNRPGRYLPAERLAT